MTNRGVWNAAELAKFATLYTKARTEPATARKHYPALLECYKSQMSRAPGSIVRRMYRQTAEIHALARSASPAAAPWRALLSNSTNSRRPQSIIMFIALITLLSFTFLLGPGITGLFGVEPVSEVLHFSSSSSTMLRLQGVPESLVFSGHWNNQGSGRLYAEFDGVRLLALDTQKLGGTAGTSVAFTDACVETCIVAIATTPDVTLVYESEGGATLNITAYGDLGDVASEPVAAPVIEEPIAEPEPISATLVESEPTPTLSISEPATEPTPTSAAIIEAPSITPSTAVFTPTGFSIESIGSTSPANGTPDSVDAQGINDGFGSTDSVTVDTINTGNDVYVGLIRANSFATSSDLEGYLNMSYNITNITTQAGVSLTNFTFFLDHCISGDVSAPVTCGTAPTGIGTTIENSAIELYNFSSGQYKKVSDWVGTSTTEGTHIFNVTQGLSDFVSATNFVNVRYVVNVTMGTLSAASLGADLAVMEAKFTIDNAPSISSAILSSTSGSNSTNDNLTVALSGVADADGDVVWNITDWRRANNTGGFESIAVLNMPFDYNVSSSFPNATPDYTTFRNNGTLGGDAEAPLWNASGKVGGAFQFDGIDDFIEINNSPSLNLNAQNLTISVWIYPSGSLGRVVCKDDGGGSRDYCVSFGDSGGLNARFFATVAAGMPVIDSTLLLPLDAWSHVAVTYDGTTFRMYINGTDDTTADVTSTLVGSSVPLRIGRSVEGYTFPGLIDEVLIFNRTLSGAQVRELFNASMNNKHLMTIHSDETQINEVWQVAVTPTDNRSDGATVLSNNLTIRDTLDSCQTLGAGTYYLGTSLTTTGPSCFNFTANHALLDCNGFSITGSRSADSHGINASSRLNVTVQNCVITNFSDGIFFTRVRRGTIFNNVIVNNSDDGIDLNNNNFTLISHNTITNNSDNGMEITGWFDNITNNTFSNNRGGDGFISHGLQTFRGTSTKPGSGPASFRIINNTIIDNQNDGFNAAWLNDSVVANNVFMRNADDAIVLTNGTSINLTGNDIDKDGDDGILLQGTNYSLIAFNTVTKRAGQSIDIVDSSNNNFTNNTLFYGNLDILRLRHNSVNNTFWNMTLVSNNSWLAVNDTSTLNNNFTNTTFANSNGSILLSFFQANISQEVNTTVLNISSNRAYLNATNLTWMNVSATIIINHTGMSFTNPIAQVDYGDTLTYEDCPADVCTTIGSSADLFIFNVSHWTSFATTDGPVEGNSITIAACGNLSAFGKTYVLTADVTSTQTCFQVQNHNITLDCNGHTVTYGGSSNIADGVNVSHARNTTIAGCTLSESASGTSSPYYSVEIRGSNDTRIINNSMFVRTSSSAGVGYTGSFSSRNNSVINNSILSHNNGYGISVAVSTGNQIIGNRIEMNGTSTGISAITLGTTSNNATIESNRIVTRDNKGITMSTSGVANMTIINNTVTSNTSTALETGAAGASGNSNIVINNTLRSVTSVALYIYSSHNLIWQNSMSTWSGNAVKIAGSANNNSLINNTLYAHNGTTIYADTTASKVRFQNTTLWSNASWFYSVHSSNTDINFTDITFAFGNGTIRFTGNGTFPIGEANITVVNMTLNASRAFVKASNMVMFNQSAEITWFNRTGDNPQLFHVLITCTAGGVCTERETTACKADTCTKQSLIDNTLKFNVSHWSAYETEEAGTYCGELFESTTVKTDLEVNTTCFTIRTSDIFLDCNGTMIIYANTTAGGGSQFGGNAVMVNSSNNVTIKNCHFRQKSSIPTDAPAVNFTNVNNSAVINTTIRTNGSNSHGIYATLSSLNNFTGLNITTVGAGPAHGIYLFTANTHNRLENNTILTTNQANYGIDLDTNANNNTLVRNNITVTQISVSSHRGIMLTGTVNNNTLQHNSVSATGAANMIGVYVYGTAMNTLIENNTIDMNGSSTGTQGIVLETAGTSSQYARIINNTIHTNGSAGSYGMFLSSNIYNTSIANNTIIANASSTGARGIYISGSVSQTNITNNVIYVDSNSTDNYGITDAGSGRFDVIVDNLIYPNGGGTGGLAYGIDLSTNSPSHSNISRNTIIGRARINIVGLYIGGANNSVFENVVDITGNAGPTGTNNRGVWLAGSAAGGSGLYNLTMRANTIVVNNTASGIGILYAPSYSGGPANPNGTNLIENNTVTVESIVGGDTGVSIENEAWWSRFVGNFIRMNGTGNLTGFDLDSADNNTIENNTVLVLGRAEGNAGVKFTGSGLANRNNVTNNAFYVEGTGNTTGANFDAAGGVTQSWFRGNNFTVNGTLPRNFGIDMEDPTPASGGPYSFNNFTGNTFTVYGLHARGIILDTKSSGAPIVRDNQFHNTTITVEGEGSYAIYVSSDTGAQPATTAFNNTVIDNAPFWTFTGSNAILNLSKIKFLTPNGSIEYPRLLMGGSNNISRFALNITQNRVFVNSTFIGGGPPSTNSSANITLNLTGMGFVIPRPAYDFHHTGINTTCDVTNCTNKGFSNSILTFNVSHWTIYTAEETTSSACGPLTTSTTLLQDVSATGTCFTIEEDGITLNCNGTTITYDTGGSGGNGVTVFDRDNTVIKNCFIQDATVAGAGSVAVNLTRANDSIIFNNTLIVNGTTTNYGVLIQTGSYRNTIANNTIRTVGGTSTNYGVFVIGTATTNSVQHNNISYNNITVNGTSTIIGIRLELNAHNTTIHGNNISVNTTLTTSNNGIFLTAASGGGVRHNNITHNDIRMRTGGTSAGIGVNTNADWNLIANNTVNVTGTSTSMIGIDVFTSVNDTVSGNNITVFASSTVIGIRTTSTAHNNKITDNRVSVNGTGGNSYGIRISTTAFGNNVTNNWARSDGTGTNVGILVDTTSTNTTIENNTVYADGSSSGNLGIQLVTTSVVGTRIAYNTIRVNGTGGNNRGIDITVSDNTTIENNTIYTYGPTPGVTQSNNYGIQLTGSTTLRTNITGNKIYTNGTGRNVGVRLDTSASLATIENNTIVTGGNETENFGILFNSLNIRNNITGNLIITNGRDSNHALFFTGSSDNNTVRYNNFSVNTNKSRGISFLNSNNTNASHNTFNGYTYINSSDNTVNNFTNTTFETPNATVRFVDLFQLNGSVNVNSSVLNLTFGRVTLNATNLTMFNVSAFITFSGLTFTEPKAVVDYTDLETYADCLSDVCSNVSYASGVFRFNVSHWTSYAVQENGTAPANSSCGVITQNTVLNQSVNSTGNCFSIIASNVTLDCNGKTIFWMGDGAAVNASHQRNVTVQNCFILDNSTSYGDGATSNTVGINFTNVTVGLIRNNTILTNDTTFGIGVAVTGITNGVGGFISITNNTINATGSAGSHYSVYARAVGTVDMNVNISSNTLLVGGTTTNFPVNLNDGAARAVNVFNNYIFNGGGGSGSNQRGISGASYDQIYNNTIYVAPGSNMQGIRIADGSNNVTGNTITVNGTSGTKATTLGMGGIVIVQSLISGPGNNLSNNKINLILTSATSDTAGAILMWQLISTSQPMTIDNNNISVTAPASTPTAAFVIQATNNFTATNNVIKAGVGIYSANITPQNVTFTNLTIESENGSIRFPGSINISDVQNISIRSYSLSNNAAFFNSTNLTFFNVSAFIVLNNLGFTNAQAVVDYTDLNSFSICPADVCTNTSYDGSTFKFNVSHWTTYAAQEFDANDAPVVISAILNTTDPLTNNTNQNLTLYLNVTDADGDHIKNITVWKLWNSTNFTPIAVLYLPFENGSSANDSTKDYAQFLNATIVTTNGTPEFNTTGGVDGRGAYQSRGLTTTSEFIRAGTISQRGRINSTTLTLMAWVKLGSHRNGLILRIGAGTDALLYIMDNQMGWYNTTGFRGRSFTNKPPLHNWTLVTYVLDGDVGYYYLNGKLNETHTGIDIKQSVLTPSSVIGVGGTSGTTAQNLNGTLDEVIVFDRALTADQIWAWFNNKSVITSSELNANETWQACVTPNDNLTDGIEVCSNNVTMQNTAPSVTSAILNTTNPSTNDTGQNLTLYLNVTDPDEGHVKNITDWQLWKGTGFASLAILNMPFAGGSNSTFTRDYSMYGRNGTVTDAIYNSTGGMDAHGAYQFDGTADKIQVASSLGLANTTGFTITHWIKTNQSAGQAYTVGNAGGGNGYRYGIHGGSVAFLIGNASKYVESSCGTSKVNDSTWHMITGVFNRAGRVFSCYVDGILDGTVVINESDGMSDSAPGIGTPPCCTDFEGEIDELLIFNRSLSAEQILAIYNNQSTILTQEETTAGDIWQACVTPNDGVVDGATVCSNNVTITGLSAPVNLYPANNSNITDRSPNFNWSNSTVGLVNYSLEIATSPDFTVASNIVFNRTNISSLVNANSTNFTINYTLDVDTVYWWRVIAYDGSSFSAYSNVTNFTLQSYVNFSLPIRHVDFGNASLGDQNDTVDESPRAFWLQNDGNVLINISVTSTRLFIGPSVDYPTANYRFKARINESDAFNSSNSTMNWTNFSLVSARMDILDLNWTVEKDDARVDVNITVPLDEPAGLRNATVTFTVP